MPTDEYESIEDWSLEGRRAFIDAHEAELRALLDEAFTELCVEVELSPYGFHGDDPVVEAVGWCVERFRSEKVIDPAKLRVESRSTRLFTEVGWWLAQKVTAKRHQTIRAAQRAQRVVRSDRSPRLQAPARPGQDLPRLERELGQTLRRLFLSTCADLVAYWLEGTRRICAAIGWMPDAAPHAEDVSPKSATFFRCDAQLRFEYLGLERRLELPATDEAALRATLFTPWSEAPYRVPDREAAAALGLAGVRETKARRKRACASLVEQLAGGLGPRPTARHEGTTPTIPEIVRWALLRSALSPSVLHALQLEGETRLRGILGELPPMKEER